MTTFAASPWAAAADAVAAAGEHAAAHAAAASLLPKALRDWPAHALCRRVVDDLGEALPLVAQLSHKSVRERCEERREERGGRRGEGQRHNTTTPPTVKGIPRHTNRAGEGGRSGEAGRQ